MILDKDKKILSDNYSEIIGVMHNLFDAVMFATYDKYGIQQ